MPSIYGDRPPGPVASCIIIMISVVSRRHCIERVYPFAIPHNQHVSKCIRALALPRSSTRGQAAQPILGRIVSCLRRRSPSCSSPSSAPRAMQQQKEPSLRFPSEIARPQEYISRNDPWAGRRSREPLVAFFTRAEDLLLMKLRILKRGGRRLTHLGGGWGARLSPPPGCAEV